MTTIQNIAPVTPYVPTTGLDEAHATTTLNNASAGSVSNLDDLLTVLAQRVDEALEAIELAEQIEPEGEDTIETGDAVEAQASECEGSDDSGYESNDEDTEERRDAFDRERDQDGGQRRRSVALFEDNENSLKPAVASLRATAETGLQALSAAAGETFRASSLPEYNIQNMINALKRAPDLFLMMLSNELTTLIDGVLEGCLQRQQERNAVMADLNAAMAELRKLAKEYPGDKKIPAGALERVLVTLHPSSPLLTNEDLKQRQLLSLDKAGPEWKALEAACLSDTKVKQWKENYAPCEVRVADDGRVHFYALPGNGKYYPNGTWGPNGYCGWIDTSKKQDVAAAREKLNIATLAAQEAQQATVADVLIAYGLYTTDKLPGTGELLDVAVENITAKVNTMSSEQQLQMLTIQKFMNGRNEAFSMSSNVNKSSADNRLTIVGHL